MKKGFTIIELLLVLVILTVCITIVALSFPKVESKQALDKAADTVLSVINEARSATLAGYQSSSYGVNFQDNQVALFQGSSYATTTASNVFTTLNSLVGIRNVYLTGSSTSVVFNRLTGATNQSGTLEVYLRSATTSFVRITISATGLAEKK